MTLGVDVTSGAYYWAAYHKVSGWLPGEGVLSGWATPGGVIATPGPRKSDGSVERTACPTLLLRQFLNDPEHSDGSTLTATEAGWSLIAPFRTDGSLPDLHVEFLIDRAGMVVSQRATHEGSAVMYHTYPESPKGFQLCVMGARNEVSLAAVRHYPEGRTWTRAEVEKIAIDARHAETRARSERDNAAQAAAPVEPRLASGEAPASVVVRTDPASRLGPALILAGVLVVVLALFVWWRQRA